MTMGGAARPILLLALCGAAAAIAGHGTRPPNAVPAVDCAMRKLTVGFAARLLGAERAAHSLHHVIDGLEYARLCNTSRGEAVRVGLLAAGQGPVRRYGRLEPAPATAVSFFVEPVHGSDAGPGTLGAPFRTVHRAIQATRSHGPTVPRTVWLRGGTHYLGQTVVLSRGDSNLTIAAYGGESPVVSGGRLLAPRWTEPDARGVSLAANVSGSFTGLFVDNRRQIRARHPDANPEYDLHPTGYIPMSQIVRKNNRWMDPPPWQQEPTQLIEISEPSWNCWSTVDGVCRNFTNAGGMSPYYQARVGGAMRRFTPPIAPGPTRSNCYEGCPVPGGVWFDSKRAFNGSGGAPPWRTPQTGIVHAIHPLNTMGAGVSIPWYNWQWRIAEVHMAPPSPPSPPPGDKCEAKVVLNHTACCGGLGSRSVKLATPSVAECAAHCCAAPSCGVAVMTVGQNTQGEVLCWLTKLASPVALRNDTTPDQGFATIVVGPRLEKATPDSIVFGDGGWQAGQGGTFGSEFFVENMPELLSMPGEWFQDAESSTLAMVRNASDPADAELVGAELASLIRVEGTQRAPVTDVRILGLTFRHTAVDYLEPYEVPGGGDQSVHRGAAVFVEGAERVAVSNCSFDSLDGSAIFFSRYNRDSSVTRSEFSKLGSAAVIIMGEANLIDGTSGNYPNRTVVAENLIRDGGVWSKNYLGGSIFQALAARSVIAQNIIYNTPRSCLTFNDNFVSRTMNCWRLGCILPSVPAMVVRTGRRGRPRVERDVQLQPRVVGHGQCLHVGFTPTPPNISLDLSPFRSTEQVRFEQV